MSVAEQRASTHTRAHSQTGSARGCSRALISILISLSHCCSSTPPSLSQRLTWHAGDGPPPRGLGGVGYYQSACRHQCTLSIIGPVIETNHSLSVSVARATHIQISFHLGRTLEGGELTCDPFLIFCQQFGGRPRGAGGEGGNLYFNWGRGCKQFARDVLHYSPKNDKIGHRAR